MHQSICDLRTGHLERLQVSLSMNQNRWVCLVNSYNYLSTNNTALWLLNHCTVDSQLQLSWEQIFFITSTPPFLFHLPALPIGVCHLSLWKQIPINHHWKYIKKFVFHLPPASFIGTPSLYPNKLPASIDLIIKEYQSLLQLRVSNQMVS